MARARSQRSRSEKRDEVRRLLLAALESLLADGDGFASVKVDDLAARAGISRASFYIHFQDKVELLEQWLTEAQDDLAAAASAWYDAPTSLGPDDLRAALLNTVRTYREHSTLMAAMHEAALYDATLRDEFEQAFEMHAGALTAHIERGQASGDIVPGRRPRETAEWLLCMIERAPTWLPASTTQAELALYVSAAANLIWATLYEMAPNRA